MYFHKWWNDFLSFFFLHIQSYIICGESSENVSSAESDKISDSAWQAEENPYCWSRSSERHRITLYWIQPDSSTPYLSCCVWRAAVTQTLSAGGGGRCELTRQLHADRCQSLCRLQASEGLLPAVVWFSFNWLHPSAKRFYISH